MRLRPLPALLAATAALAVPALVTAQEPAYNLPPAPAPAPPPPPAGPAKPPLKPLKPVPALRRVALIERVRGKASFQLPGEERRRRLSRKPTAVPMDTIVNAGSGRVRLTVARDTRGGRSRGVFYGGRFMISQGRGKRPLTHLRLVGEFETTCASASARAATATAAAKKPRRRRLWGDGKGRFRTRGFYSAATVRGTKWLVEDRCDGTVTRVVRGEVEVVDFSGDAATSPPPQETPETPQTDTEGAPVGGPPAPALAPGATGGGGTRARPRRVRLKRGGTYVASPRS